MQYSTAQTGRLIFTKFSICEYFALIHFNDKFKIGFNDFFNKMQLLKTQTKHIDLHLSKYAGSGVNFVYIKNNKISSMEGFKDTMSETLNLPT